jgi:phosphatidylglycerol:prolipoprotein diacylglycerol transferase
MHPILFEIPGIGFPVRSFGVMVVLGFLLGTKVLTVLAERTALDQERESAGVQALPVWAMVGIIGGARVLYVIVEVMRALGRPAAERAGTVGQSFLDEPIQALFIWEGGLVMYGGAFGGLLASYWCMRKYGLHVPHMCDVGVPAAYFGLAIGRIGCLLVGDDYGSVVPPGKEGLPFPIALKVPDLAWLEAHEASLFEHDLAGKTLWATQPWMSVNALLLGCIGVWLLRRRRYPGQVALVVLLLYSVTRFLIEQFRGDEIRGVWESLGGISTSQLISILLFAACAALLFRWRRRRETWPPVPLTEPEAQPSA